MNYEYMTIDELKNEFGLTDNVSGQEIKDADISYYIKRASSKINVITSNYIPKMLASNSYTLNNGKLTIDTTKFITDELKEEQLKLGALKEALGRLVKFGIDTGYDFISGSFSQSIGAISQSEQLDFETSYLRLEKEVRELLAIYDFSGIKTSPTTYGAFSFGISDDEIAEYSAFGDKKINAKDKPLTLGGLYTALTSGLITNAKMLDNTKPSKGIYIDIDEEVNNFLKANPPTAKLNDGVITTNLIKDGAVTMNKINNEVKVLFNSLGDGYRENKEKITTHKNEIAQNKIALTNNTNEINTLKARPIGGVNIDKVAAAAKRAADQVRHEVGLNPTQAFADFATLGITTTKIINDYDNKFKTSEYGIFNAIFTKMDSLRLSTFAVQGRVDDTNNALFSLFFKQVLTKANGDFLRSKFSNVYQGDDARITVFFRMLSNYFEIYILLENPNKNFNNTAYYISDVKDKRTGNWDASPVESNMRTTIFFTQYHEYIDDEELFISSNNEITSLKEWKDGIKVGVNHNKTLLTIVLKNNAWVAVEPTPITVANWNATTQELTLNLPYKFGGYISMRGRMKYSASAINCEIAFKDRTQSNKYYSYERSGTQNGNAPTFVSYPAESSSRNYFIIFEGGDSGKARIVNGEFSINDDQVDCINFETINIKNTEFYKAKVDSVYDQSQNPWRNDGTKQIVLQFRNVRNLAQIKDGSFISLTMTKGSVSKW